MQCKSCRHNNPGRARFCTNCGGALPIPSEPGVFSSYRNGWRQLWSYFLILLLITIIYYVITAIPMLLSIFYRSELWSVFIQYALNIFIIAPLGYGLAFVALNASREGPVEFNDLFEGFRNYWNAILASILLGIIVVIGIFLLIIPGIYMACRLAFTPYLVVDRKMGAIDAIQASWQMTKGYAWKVFLMGLLAIPIVIAGFLCLGIGVIVAFMWMAVAYASFYYAVSELSWISPQKRIPVT